MKTTHHLGHLIGDHVSVRVGRAGQAGSYRPGGPGDRDASWLGGRIIARDVRPGTRAVRYVVQLDDDRRVVAFDEDVRRFTLAFEVCEMLEKMAS